MIYEFKTDDVKPGALGEVEKRFGEAYEHRRKLSPLVAFWRVEIGPLNQIIHVWPYKDMEERARIHAQARKDGNWPARIDELLVAQRSDIMVAAPYSPALKPAQMGPYFEIRTYTVAAGALPNVLDNWEKALPERTALSPLVGLFHTQADGPNKWLQIWAYPTLDERERVRAKAHASGAWPPSALAAREGRKSIPYVAQENKIVTPAKFSPLQ